MLNYLKIDLIESINIINQLAAKGSKSLPDEICRFLKTELNFDDVFISEDKSVNKFVVTGKTFIDKKYPNISSYSIKMFDELVNSVEFESDLICECEIYENHNVNNLQCFLINIGKNYRFNCGVIHKYQPSDAEKDKLNELMKFIQVNIAKWKNHYSELISPNRFNKDVFINKTIKGLIREIKTNNGLLTLINEERISSEVQNYVDEIRTHNLKLLNSINDLSKLADLENVELNDAFVEINFPEILEELKRNLKAEGNHIEMHFENQVSNILTYKKEIIYALLENVLNFLADIKGVEKIILKSEIRENKKLWISYKTKSLKLTSEKLSILAEPFENADISNRCGGLILTLISKYIDAMEGSLKLFDDNSEFKINISLPVKADISDKIDRVIEEQNEDKILVIESDVASSTLLKNHLQKWDYSYEIVNSGSQALRKLTESKYIAVILNIEQEEENSLLILQQIKNNKQTRNTPVIVFSVEPDKEKIYLMGSVDYLVKPINYNNLLEILNSYKLRRNSTVLCVDDDKPTLNLLKQAVQTSGFNILAFHRPEFVLDEIIDKDIDLAIIDLDMPVLNGFDLIKEIKSLEKFSKLPIIIYTGQEDYHKDLAKIDGMFVELFNKRSTSFNQLEKSILDMINSYEEPLKDNSNMDGTKGPKILMAEDYKHSQIIVTRLLKKSGFENVIVVENGEEALNICENDKIDLILMDMQMPIMNGFEATGKIRELAGYEDTPIISLTAFAMKGDREKCLEAGATDYIPKPIDSKEFIEKVKYYTQVTVSE